VISLLEQGTPPIEKASASGMGAWRDEPTACHGVMDTKSRFGVESKRLCIQREVVAYEFTALPGVAPTPIFNGGDEVAVLTEVKRTTVVRDEGASKTRVSGATKQSISWLTLRAPELTKKKIRRKNKETKKKKK